MECSGVNHFISPHNNAVGAMQTAVTSQHGMKNSQFYLPSSTYQGTHGYDTSYTNPVQPQEVMPPTAKTYHYSYNNNPSWRNNNYPAQYKNQNFNFNHCNSDNANYNKHIGWTNGLQSNEKNITQTSKIRVRDMFSLNNGIGNQVMDNNMYQAVGTNQSNCPLTYFNGYAKEGLPQRRHYENIDYSAYRNLRPDDSHLYKILVNKVYEPCGVNKPHEQQIANSNFHPSQLNVRDVSMQKKASFNENYTHAAEPVEKQVNQNALKRSHCPNVSTPTLQGMQLGNKRVKISPRRNSSLPNASNTPENINQGEKYYTCRSVPLTNIPQSFVPPVQETDNNVVNGRANDQHLIDNDINKTKEVSTMTFNNRKPHCSIASDNNSSYQNCYTSNSCATNDSNYYSSNTVGANYISNDGVSISVAGRSDRSSFRTETLEPDIRTVPNMERSRQERLSEGLENIPNIQNSNSTSTPSCPSYNISAGAKSVQNPSSNIRTAVDNNNCKSMERFINQKNCCVNEHRNLLNSKINETSNISVEKTVIDLINNKEFEIEEETAFQEKKYEKDILNNENQLLDKDTQTHLDMSDIPIIERLRRSVDELTDNDIEQSVFFSKKPGPKSKTMSEALRATKDRIQKLEIFGQSKVASESFQKSARNEENKVSRVDGNPSVPLMVPKEEKSKHPNGNELPLSEKKYENKINREKLDMLIEFLETDSKSVESLPCNSDCESVNDSSPMCLNLSDSNSQKDEDNNLSRNRRKLSKTSVVKNKNNTREMISLVTHKTRRLKDSLRKLDEMEEREYESKIMKENCKIPKTGDADGRITSGFSETESHSHSIIGEKQEKVKEYLMNEKNCIKEEPNTKVNERSENKSKEKTEHSHHVHKSSPKKTPLGHSERKNCAFENKNILNAILSFQKSQNNKCMYCQSTFPNCSFWANIVSGELRCLNCFKIMIAKSEELDLKAKKSLKMNVNSEKTKLNGTDQFQKENEKGNIGIQCNKIQNKERDDRVSAGKTDKKSTEKERTTDVSRSVEKSTKNVKLQTSFRFEKESRKEKDRRGSKEKHKEEKHKKREEDKTTVSDKVQHEKMSKDETVNESSHKDEKSRIRICSVNLGKNYIRKYIESKNKAGGKEVKTKLGHEGADFGKKVGKETVSSTKREHERREEKHKLKKIKESDVCRNPCNSGKTEKKHVESVNESCKDKEKSKEICSRESEGKHKHKTIAKPKWFTDTKKKTLTNEVQNNKSKEHEVTKKSRTRDDDQRSTSMQGSSDLVAQLYEKTRVLSESLLREI